MSKGVCGKGWRTGEKMRRAPPSDVTYLEQFFPPVADLQFAYPHFPNAAGRYGGTTRTDRASFLLPRKKPAKDFPDFGAHTGSSSDGMARITPAVAWSVRRAQSHPLSLANTPAHDQSRLCRIVMVTVGGQSPSFSLVSDRPSDERWVLAEFISDLLTKRAESLHSKHSLLFVDVGSGSGEPTSVTSYLHSALGGRGICIEPRADAQSALRRNRPECEVHQVALGDARRSADLHVAADPEHSVVPTMDDRCYGHSERSERSYLVSVLPLTELLFEATVIGDATHRNYDPDESYEVMSADFQRCARRCFRAYHWRRAKNQCSAEGCSGIVFPRNATMGDGCNIHCRAGELRKVHGAVDTGEHFWVRSADPPSLRTEQVAYLHIDIHGEGMPVIRGTMLPTPPGRPARLRRSSFLLPFLDRAGRFRPGRRRRGRRATHRSLEVRED